MCKSVQALDFCDSLWKIADKNNVFLLGKSLKNYHGLVLSNVRVTKMSQHLSTNLNFKVALYKNEK
jgi:hypothetical protein